ncbi:uncharacterized protein LOC132697152 [Cylas formicarius]|uniref:uncharacterized protein LOC132697152 n=1 Tax=Cylas formicarius TaxID=197179 RepID=UPI0029588EAA|nr:uncharacterized protein LOC132697152 [Cylas formicarius]
MTLIENVLASLFGTLLLANPPVVKADSCTISSYDQVASVVSSCTTVTVGSFTVPAGKSLDLKFKDGAYVTFKGEIRFEHYNWDGALISIEVNNGIVKGDENNLFLAFGESYWGCEGAKPLFMRLVGVHTGCYGLKLKNCPQRCVSINRSRNSVFGNFVIDNAEGVGTGLTIKDTIVTNQDDCVAINAGKDNVLVDNLQCIGSHGFDIVSGQGKEEDNHIRNITFQNSVLIGGMVGLSMLSVIEGVKGEVSNIIYNNIKIQGPSDYAIMFHQDFSNAIGGSTGVPVGTVVFKDITLNNVSGYVEGQYSAKVCLRCALGYCNNINFNGVDLSGGNYPDECTIQPNALCNNALSNEIFDYLARIAIFLLIQSVTIKADSCNINSYDQVASVASCTTITVGSFTVPGGKSLELKLRDGAYITFTGEIRFEHYNWDGPLILIDVNNGIVKGDNNNLFNGLGESYWEYTGTKPLFMRLVGTHTGFYGLKLKNCPQRCVSINRSKNSVIGNFVIDNVDGVGKAKNTDGFDIIKSSGLVVKDTTVTNQDDCVAINAGTSNILVDNFQCIGSHGFDISSGLGKDSDNFISNITFQNSLLSGGMVGLSMLSHIEGARGEVRDINYSNIKIEGPSDYAIMFHQDFSTAIQGNTGIPVGTVDFRDINLNGVTGYVEGQYSARVCLRCAAGYCENISFNNVNLSGGNYPDECSIQPNGYKCITK